MRKKGIITAAAHSHKDVLSDTEFHCKTVHCQAHGHHHILHPTEVRDWSCQGFILAFLILSTSSEVPAIWESCGYKRLLAFIYKKQNENDLKKKKAVFVDPKLEICSVYPKTEGKWKQQKSIFFLCFRYSHSPKKLQYLPRGWVRISLCMWPPALHHWHYVSWLRLSPDLWAEEAVPRDISRLCKSLMAELKREPMFLITPQFTLKRSY